MTADFIEILDSFNLTQAIHEPTHAKGHCLDLVIFTGLSPVEFLTKDICVSDHKLVLFSVVLSQPSFIDHAPVHRRVFNSTSASKFTEHFISASLTAFNPDLNPVFNTEELVSLFNHTCQTILDSVAPLKLKRFKKDPQPWLTESTNERVNGERLGW